MTATKSVASVSDSTLQAHFAAQYQALTGVQIPATATLTSTLEMFETAVHQMNDANVVAPAAPVNVKFYSSRSHAIRALHNIGAAALHAASTLLVAGENDAFGFNLEAAEAVQAAADNKDELDTSEPAASTASTPEPVVTKKPADPVKFNPVAPKCPECGSENDQTWATEGVSVFCHHCSTTYSIKTGKKINAGFTRPNAPSGYTIQKDRPEQNGVKRQSAGSVGDKLWTLFDTVGEALDIKGAKEMAEAANLSTTSATIAFYNWRKFNGFAKAAK